MSTDTPSRMDKRRYNKMILVSIISIIIAIVFSSLTLYFQFFYEKEPNITLEIVSESNVVDVYEPVEDLTVSFRGEDILKNNKNLRIFTICIANSGKDVLSIHYNKNDMWGFRVENGEIIKIESISGTRSASSFNPTKIGKNTIKFENVMFEKGDYFYMNIFVLHDKYILPSITTFENIAGMDKIEIVDKRREERLEQCLYEKEIIITIFGIGIVCFLGGFIACLLFLSHYSKKDHRRLL